MRPVFTLLLGTAMLSLLSVPFAMAAAASVGNPLVLELFTSQGCSSCPPADRYLGELKQARPDFLVLDFHVDYWDSLGWKDPFSMQAATARQQAYDALLASEVYTPQLVIGGSRQAIGSDRAGVADAVASAEADRAATTPVTLALSTNGSALTIDIGAGRGPAQLWLVGYDDRHTTHIGRGENGGVTETEVDIVRSIAPVSDWTGAARHLSLTRPLGQHVAILLQRADGLILSAAVLPSGATS